MLRLSALVCVLGLVACGEDPDPAPIETPDAGQTDAAPETLTVAVTWGYWITPNNCTSDALCGEDPSCGLTPCTCHVGQADQLTFECCADSVELLEADLDQLVADLPMCELNQTSPVTYELLCPWTDSPIYWAVDRSVIRRGEPLKHTNNLQCSFSPPYAL